MFEFKPSASASTSSLLTGASTQMHEFEHVAFASGDVVAWGENGVNTDVKHVMQVSTGFSINNTLPFFGV